MYKTTLKTRSHCVYSLQYHLVLVTKYRRNCLTERMLETIKSLIDERCLAREGQLLEFNGESDHVHLLVSLPPHVKLSEFVNAVKTNTARILRRDFAVQLAQIYSGPVLWSRSYCVLSCGGTPLELLKQYIRQQDRPN